MSIKINYFDGGTLLPSDLINEKMSLLTDGVYGVTAGGFLGVQHSPANLSIDIAAGEAQKIGYYIKSDAVVNPAITANTSGYNRKDIIVLEVNTTLKTTTLKAIMGTPSSSPTAPLPTADQLLLQEVFVGNNVSVINTANITDKRVDVDLFGGQLANIAVVSGTDTARVTKYANGQMEIEMLVTVGSTAVTIAFGALFISAAINLGNFPVAFSQVPYVTINLYCSNGSTLILANQGAPTASALPGVVAVRQVSTTLPDISFYIMAKGRWK